MDIRIEEIRLMRQFKTLVILLAGFGIGRAGCGRLPEDRDQATEAIAAADRQPRIAAADAECADLAYQTLVKY